MPHCCTYILTLGLAGLVLTTALPTSNDGVELGHTYQHELQRAIRSSDDSLGPRDTLSITDRLEQLLSEVTEYTASDHITCESPQPQYNQFGLLPHPRSCWKFYICDQQSQTVFVYKCPPGLVFNKELGLCTIPLPDDANENCREPGPEMHLEISGTPKPRKRRASKSYDSLSAHIRCQEESNNIISAAEEVKNDAISIDRYVAHINDLRPLAMPLAALRSQNKNYRRVLQNYNADLEIAKTNAKVWKGDNGVLEAINQTLAETKKFDPVFNDGFENFLRGIDFMLNGEGEFRTATYEMVKVKRQITKLEEILTGKVHGFAYGFFKALLAKEKQKLRNLEDAYKGAETGYNFPKLINFLNFIIDPTAEAQKAVALAESKIHDFEVKVFEDSGKFQRHLSVAKENSLMLVEESNENMRLKASLPQKKQKLLQQKSSTETSLSDAKRKKAIVEAQLHQLRRRSKRSPFEPFTLFAIATGVIAGAGIISGMDDDDEDRRAILRQQLRDHENNINSLSHNIQFLVNSINEYDREIESVNKRSETLQKEIAYFRDLLLVFEDMKNSVTPVIPLINKAKESIISIGKIFDEISLKLTSMLEDAREAEDHLKRRDLKYFIYNEIGVMKCTWQSVSSRLTLLEAL